MGKCCTRTVSQALFPKSGDLKMTYSGSLKNEEFPDLDIRERHFDSKELMQAYLDGINEFAGDERAPGDWCVMDYDDLNKLKYE